MRLDPAEARALFVSAPVARLATVRPDGSPHVVPVCFALAGDAIYTAVAAVAFLALGALVFRRVDDRVAVEV